jgi:DNA-binding MarR family transcriptional regulator
MRAIARITTHEAVVSYAKDMSAVPASGDERTLASRLRLAVVRLNRRLRAQRSEDRTVTLTQFSALSTLDKHGPMSPGELAARERVQPPSMTRVISALEESGLVTRRPHPTDGRQTVIEATTAGKDYVAAEVQARERWLDQRLAALSDEERRVLCRAAEIIDRMAGS